MRSKKLNNDGMASILITMIMMLVISLIVIGFSQVTRRSQREALDRQLGTQAYYAAESGVNVAAAWLQANPTIQVDTLTNPNCTQFQSNYVRSTTINELSTSDNVRFTCLMVNSYPPKLRAAPLSESSNLIWNVQNNNAGQDITTLQFDWAKASHSGASGGCPGGTADLPPHQCWTSSFGILRFDIARIAGPGPFDANYWASNTRTVLAVPSNSGTGVVDLDAGSAQQPGFKVPVQCSSTSCTLTANMTSGNFASDHYYVRLSMYYLDSKSLTLSGEAAGGNNVRFKDGQVDVDATGQSQDELKRLYVVLPLQRTDLPIPNFEIGSSASICKQIQGYAAPQDVYLNPCP